MIKCSLFLTLALFTIQGFAQTTLTAAQVCQRVANANPSNGSVCAQLISRNFFEPSLLSLANKAVEKGTSISIELLKAGANRRLESNAGLLCEGILEANPQNAVICLNTVLDLVFAPELIRVATKLIPQGSSNAINAIKAGGEAYFFAPLMDICEAMVSANPANTVACIQLIANKVSLNSSEQVCRTSLAQGTSYALQCLQGVVIDYAPIPQPTTVMVETYQLQDIKRSLLKARSLIDRGQTDSAKRALEESISGLDLILNNP